MNQEPNPASSPAEPIIEAVVYSDGARRNEAGPVGWGCEVNISEGPRHQRFTRSGILESNSTMLAEIHAALTGVELALEHGAKRIAVYTDSLGLVDFFHRKNHLPKNPDILERFEQLKAYSEQVDLHWVWLRSHRTYKGSLTGGRAGNNKADSLARRALNP